MLVMSRRKDEKIVFPGIGITITLVNVRGNTARIGIDAPREITILRDEVGRRNNHGTAPDGYRSNPHGIRNILNSINLFVMLHQRQMAAGQVKKAALTFMKMVDFLELQTAQNKLDFEINAEQAASLSGNIMIVEDDNHQRELLTDLLSTYGMQVAAFEHGQKALNELRDGNRPDIVILDWSMPQFGGEWLIPKIRRELGESSPKLFVLTGSDLRPDNAGADAWIAKPVNHEALLARIRAAHSTAC